MEGRYQWVLPTLGRILMSWKYDDDIEPEDAIIFLNPERTQFDVDVPMFLVATLRKNWNMKNTDRPAPIINLAENKKLVNFRDADYITVFEQPGTGKALGVQYEHQNDLIVIQFELLCSGGRPDMVRLEGEMRRILWSIRTDTFGSPTTSDLSGRQWMEYGIRRTPMRLQDKGQYRRHIDCEVNWRAREVQT